VTRTLLNRLAPELAIVSVGSDNPFGHPHREVLDLLQQAEVPVLRTDEQGWVALRLGSWGLAAETQYGLNGDGLAGEGPAGAR
jgi:beta-lactamase superfamily II metal-dependent hydrolase